MNFSRRQFVKTSALSSIGFALTPGFANATTGKRLIEQVFAGWNVHDADKVVASFS